jgi:hypothetical protein
LAQVPIIFHQTDVPEAYLHTTVKCTYSKRTIS